MKVLVYGATGSQMASAPSQLLEKGHEPYVVTRSLAKAKHLENIGATILEGEMSDKEFVRTITKGMDAVLLLIPFSSADHFELGKIAIDAAKEQSVSMIIWNTSGPVTDENTDVNYYDARAKVLNYLKDSGVPYIVFQPGAYAENLLGPWTAPFVKSENKVAYPVPTTTRIGWLVSADLTALMVEALDHPELSGSSFQVSGQKNLNGEDLAKEFSEGLGRSISYYAMPPKDFALIIDQVFGPGSGESVSATYQKMWDNPDQTPPFYTDMRPVLEKLPVRLTPISQWVKQNAKAFN